MKRLLSIISLLFICTLAHADNQPQPHLHVPEVLGIIGAIVTLLLGIIGFFVRRSVFREIDELKEKKQDKTLCEQIESVACRDREEIKQTLKDGFLEFKGIHKKIDRIMWKMKLTPEDHDGE